MSLAATGLVAATATTDAYSHCTVTPLSPSGSRLAEEGSNPVTAGSWAYAGYTSGNNVVIVPATGYGEQLGTPVTVFSGTGPAADLRLGALSSQVYATWLMAGSHGAHEIMFGVSHDHGAQGSWNAPVDLGPTAPNLPQIAFDGRNVHVAFRKTDGMVTISNSTNNGRSFSPPVPIAAGFGEIVMVSHGNDVYVSWNTDASPRYDVALAASHDGGATFKVHNLSQTRPSSSREPILALDAVSGRRLSLIWREDSPAQVIYRQSLDGANTWTAPLVIDAPVRQAMIVDDGTTILISYLKKFIVNGVDDWQAFITTSTDGGKSFPSPRNLSGPSGVATLVGDDYRPMPWLKSDHMRLTAVKSDGVYVWNGTPDHPLHPFHLGAGLDASPSFNVSAWLGPNRIVTFAYCQ